jgi:predicted 3-demethylubiquinone-9 3-methyltransferase (glyoxalase superfamily)
VECENQKQIDTLYDALAVNGELQPCGWVKDRYGVSWQIVPDFLWKIDEDVNKDLSQKVMCTLYKMNKIDLIKIKEIWTNK